MDSSLSSAVVIVVVAFAAFRLLPRLLAGVPFVEPKVVHARLTENENAVILDVRTKEEFENEHAVGSLNVQPRDFAEDMDQKKAYLDTPIYLMCLTSQRAAMAAKPLKNLGFKNVNVIKGGIVRWKKQGLPVK